MESLENLITQLRALPPARQLVLVATTLGSLAFFGWLTFGAATPEYRALYRGLAPEEAARVADALTAEGIAFQLADGGTSLMVSATEVAEARIRVAGRGLPGGSGAGFELFDEPAFGVTDFVHRINYVRAVQGELARSIEQLEPVERARVQVVMPERRSVLAAVERKPSASVVVALRAGRTLDADQVQAVVHLVASSIENMDRNDVTVVDGAGHLLAPVDDMGPGRVAGVGASSHQQRLEAELGKRIESIVEKTVGPGNVVARVNAVLDWSESETTEETFDPEGQIARSEQRSTELTSDGNPQGGAAGAIANLATAGGAGGGAAAGNGSSRTSETINYEISKKVSRTVQPMGRIKRLSVAVLVADQPGESPEAAPVPWSEESLGLFEGLAREAVGIDEQRGDRITVSSAPFRTLDPEIGEAPSFWPQWSPLLVALARGAMVLAALFLFANNIVRPVLQTLPVRTEATLPRRVADLEAQLADGGGAGGGDNRISDGLAAAAAGGGASAGPSIDDSLRALRSLLNQG